MIVSRDLLGNPITERSVDLDLYLRPCEACPHITLASKITREGATFAELFAELENK